MARASEPDRDRALRRRVAGIAGYSGDEPSARAAVHDDSPEVRAAGLGALARMAALQPGDLVLALADAAAPVRRRACELAGRNQAPSLVSPLVTALSDPVPAVAEAACYALGELVGAGPSRQVVAALAATASGHPDALCREAAVAALGALGSPDGLPAVMTALADRPAVRRRAVVALAAFEGDIVEAALVKAARDTDWQVRQAAEDLLGARPRPGSAHQ